MTGSIGAGPAHSIKKHLAVVAAAWLALCGAGAQAKDDSKPSGSDDGKSKGFVRRTDRL